MELSFKYGTGQVTANIPDQNVAGVIMPHTGDHLPRVAEAVQEALANPVKSPPLAQLLRERAPRRVVIVVNDVTRPTPYRQLLPPLLSTLAEGGVDRNGITLLVATGAHRGNTPEENRHLFGAEIAAGYRIINHHPDQDLVELGRLSGGQRLQVNRAVVEGDFLITTGIIIPHEIAGFSGGRKSILPGVAGRELITRHHALMTHPKVAAGRWRDNPAHLLMVEAARKVGVDFILNVVANEEHQLLKVVAGDLEAAWEEGVRHSARVHVINIYEPAEVVLAGAGGYPRDINVYQMAKPLRNATRAATAQGTVILVAECPGGYGDDTLAQWLMEAYSPKEIMARFHQGFVLGGHKAFALAQVVAGREVILVSSLGEERTRRLYMTPARDLQAALGYVRQKHGDDFRALIMPQAGLVLPVLGQQETTG